MVWTSKDEHDRLCKEWFADPLINPSTGHEIQRGGPTFLEWQEKCGKKPLATGQMTFIKCQQWERQKDINPDSGRKIKIGGQVYKTIEKQCKILGRSKTITLLGEYYVPDTNGMVPTVSINGTNYLVRRYQNHKVYGPLNKVARAVSLVYYQDTWDYRNDHYAPVFPNGMVPKRPVRQQSKIVGQIEAKSTVDKILGMFK